jgi:hypothetical protein
MTSPSPPPLITVHPAPPSTDEEVSVLFLNQENQEDTQYDASSSSSPSSAGPAIDDDGDDLDGLVYGFESDVEYGFPVTAPPRPKDPTVSLTSFFRHIVCIPKFPRLE